MEDNKEKVAILENESTVEKTLVHAIKNGLREAVISELTSNPQQINACTVASHTPFELALQYGYLSLAADIADLNGFDLNCEGHNPLRASITVGAVQLAEKLLEQGANPNYYQEGLGSLLLLAIESGLYPLAERLIQKGAEVNFRDQRGWTALMYASFKGDKRTTEFLLDQNADPNIRNNDGWNAVVGAMATGHTEIVDLLMKRGGVFGEKYAQAAMVSCFKKGDYKLAIKLLESGINPNFYDGKNEPLLIQAINNNNKEFALTLLDYGANPNSVSNYGDPALNLCAFKGFNEIIQKLYDCGADMNFYNGQTSAVICAASYNLPDTIQLLARLGCSVNARDSKGNTALHIASKAGYSESVTALLNNGCNVNINNYKGNSAKDVASSYSIKGLL